MKAIPTHFIVVFIKKKPGNISLHILYIITFWLGSVGKLTYSYRLPSAESTIPGWSLGANSQCESRSEARLPSCLLSPWQSKIGLAVHHLSCLETKAGWTLKPLLCHLP